MRGLKDKVVVIAGGGRGIGAATARRFGEEGAHVVVGDLRGEAAAGVAESINAAGGSAIAVTFDISVEETVQELAARAVERFGGIDAWHNNAAALSRGVIGIDMDADALTVPLDVWAASFQTNTTGYLLGIRAALPELVRRGAGSIINTGSDGTFMAMAGFPAYLASKSALLSLTRHVAKRWGKQGIRCNIVSPGLIFSETALKTMPEEAAQKIHAEENSHRIGRPEDLAAAVAFLASDDAEWINGQVLSVNGGNVMR